MEETAPHRSLLIMSEGDFLECKTSGYTLHYNGKERPETIDGYIKFKEIPVEMTKLRIADLMKEFEFTSMEHAKEIRDKIEEMAPDLKITGERALDAFDEEIKPSVDENVKEKDTKSDEVEKKEEKPKQSQKGQKFKVKLKNLGDLKEGIKKAGLKTKPAVKSDKPSWPGTIVVGTLGYFKSGFVLAHTYLNEQKEEEIVMLKMPQVNELPSFPFLFAKEKQGDYFLKGLTNHPRWNESAVLFKVTALASFDATTVNTSAILVKDPKTLLKAMARKSGDNGKNKTK